MSRACPLRAQPPGPGADRSLALAECSHGHCLLVGGGVVRTEQDVWGQGGTRWTAPGVRQVQKLGSEDV